MSTIAEYGGQHAELIALVHRLGELEKQWAEASAREREADEHRRIEKGRAEALELWDNAYTICLGQEIDWVMAWKKADEYQRYKNDEWIERYEKWLIETAPKRGRDSFHTFLAQTENIDKYDQSVKRHWSFKLLKSVLRQLGKSQWEPWVQQLVIEQIAKRDIAAEYDSFEWVLDSCGYSIHTGNTRARFGRRI